MPLPGHRLIALAAALAAGLAAATPSFADRMPTVAENARITAALKKEGFIRWDEEIELTDGVWEVLDAVAADGTRYILELDQKTLAITLSIPVGKN